MTPARRETSLRVGESEGAEAAGGPRRTNPWAGGDRWAQVVCFFEEDGPRLCEMMRAEEVQVGLPCLCSPPFRDSFNGAMRAFVEQC